VAGALASRWGMAVGLLPAVALLAGLALQSRPAASEPDNAAL
jgi:hypothetical protein